MTEICRTENLRLVLKHPPIFVVYFDQRMGAPHAVRWSKSFFWRQDNFFRQVLWLNVKKRQKITIKCVRKGGYFPPLLCMILCGIPLIFCLFCSASDGKSCFSIRKSILTREWCAEHPFAGQNTQQITLSQGFSNFLSA